MVHVHHLAPPTGGTVGLDNSQLVWTELTVGLDRTHCWSKQNCAHCCPLFYDCNKVSVSLLMKPTWSCLIFKGKASIRVFSLQLSQLPSGQATHHLQEACVHQRREWIWCCSSPDSLSLSVFSLLIVGTISQAAEGGTWLDVRTAVQKTVFID